MRGGGEEEEMAEVVMEAAGKEAERVEGATAVVARMAARAAARRAAGMGHKIIKGVIFLL